MFVPEDVQPHQTEPAGLPESTLDVLGTPLMVTTYAHLTECCQRWAERASPPMAIEFANTQVVTMRRHQPEFRQLSGAFDKFIPDGMPLVWCMNRLGAGLRDRVYGPTFFRYFLQRCPAGFRHYFVGGSPEVGARLREVIAGWNPQVEIAGMHHGRVATDGRLEDESVLDEIRRLAPDFVWLGLGTPKQQAWVHRYKTKLDRGLLMSVGFAFDVNAGTKKDAPMFMQRMGLTWLFRLVTEPARLGPRYVRYNTLFLYYLFRDGLRSRKAGGGLAQPEP